SPSRGVRLCPSALRSLGCLPRRVRRGGPGGTGARAGGPGGAGGGPGRRRGGPRPPAGGGSTAGGGVGPPPPVVPTSCHGSAHGQVSAGTATSLPLRIQMSNSSAITPVASTAQPYEVSPLPMAARTVPAPATPAPVNSGPQPPAKAASGAPTVEPTLASPAPP